LRQGHIPFHNNSGGSSLEGIVDVVVAISSKTLNADKDVPWPDFSRIVMNSFYLRFQPFSRNYLYALKEAVKRTLQGSLNSFQS